MVGTPFMYEPLWGRGGDGPGRSAMALVKLKA